MKKTIAAFITGLAVATTASAYAASVTAVDNTYKVTVNGKEANISGYNINGSTYFKLRDVADSVGGFSVGFENNVITIATTAPSSTGQPMGERPMGSANGAGASVEEMKSRLAQEVADGKITQAQADEMISQMESGNLQRGNLPFGSVPQN